jgi:hypothetical protein
MKGNEQKEIKHKWFNTPIVKGYWFTYGNAVLTLLFIIIVVFCLCLLATTMEVSHG